MRRICITGAGGQLAHALQRELGPQAISLLRARLDITSSRSVQHAIDESQPDVIVNCAAHTNVDSAEQDDRIVRRVNADAVAELADICRQRDIPLVQVSTDYVFGADSRRAAPYREDETPGPINAYGRSKLGGELAAAQWAKHFIVRTCGLYGTSAHGRNFVETILRAARSGRPLSVVDDQYCTPSNAADVAHAVAFLLTTNAYGTYHVVNEGATTWHDFAAEILRIARLDVPLRRISSKEYGGTLRPAYSVLDTSKYLALGGPRLRPWQAALAEYLRERGGEVG